MNALTEVLQVSHSVATDHLIQSQSIEPSATAYFASICNVVLSQGKKPDDEVVAYCFAALISQVSIAVIQNQNKQIFQIITQYLTGTAASEYTSKYGVIAL